MTEPVIVPRAEHPISRRDIDPDALKVLYRLHESGYTAYLVGGSVRDLLLEPAAEGLRHRHVGASLSDQEAVPELLDHRPALPPGARALRPQDDRGRHVPAPHRRRVPRAKPTATPERGAAGRSPRATGPADAQRRCMHASTTTPSARPKRMRSGATSPSTRCSTTSRRFRSSTTSAACRTCKDGVIRCIGDPQRALPGRPGAHAARDRRWRRGWTSRSIRPIVDAIATHRAPDGDGVAGAADRGVLQDSALRRTPSGRSAALAEHGLLEPVTPEIQRGAEERGAVGRASRALDAYRRQVRRGAAAR